MDLGTEVQVGDAERMAETTCPSRTKSRAAGVEHWDTGGGMGQGLCGRVGTAGKEGLGNLGARENPSTPESGEVETTEGSGM